MKSTILIYADTPLATRLDVILPVLQPMNVRRIGSLADAKTQGGALGLFIQCTELESLAEIDVNFPCIALDEETGSLLARAGRRCLQVVSGDAGYLDWLEALYRLNACRGEVWDHANTPLKGVIAVSPAMREVNQLLERLKDKSVTVMIKGPSGAGKELIARAVHDISPRSNGPFVPINCGAIPRELLESELFGHEKGAFTGAISSRAGRFELAEGGTLFLDEIGDMPLDMQVKILRVIQERAFERVGSNKTLQADVRIIAATHRDLEAMIAAGDFREDLYYRLDVFPIEVPGLADRREDIPHLIRDIASQLEMEGLGKLRLAASAEKALREHHWAGNVRELANLLERLLIMYPDRLIGLGDLPERYRQGQDLEGWRPASALEAEPVTNPVVELLPEQGMDLKEQARCLEIAWIEQALARSNGVVSKAASLLGLRRTTLIEKMRKYGISSD